uniref:Uncharacterized protein n=1 Tax=Tanacetum cinerariifolium TaxID=118510 RepID=A0A699HQJ9_TANCI|nr:hypothetical protein [Tanacetum cinerariifolium]
MCRDTLGVNNEEVGSPFFWQWEHPPLAVGKYTASGNSLLAVGMPCTFYSQQIVRNKMFQCILTASYDDPTASALCHC